MQKLKNFWNKGCLAKIVVLIIGLTILSCLCSVPTALFAPDSTPHPTKTPRPTQTPRLTGMPLPTKTPLPAMTSRYTNTPASRSQSTLESQPTATFTDVSTSTPVPIASHDANLRSGPGTNYQRVDAVKKGERLDIVGQTDDGGWLKLAGGTWIASFLVSSVPSGVPVITDIPTPSVTATSSPKMAKMTIDVRASGADEIVTITNVGNAPGSLAGWRINSYGNKTCQPLSDQVYVFQDVILNPGDSVRVHSGPKAQSNPPSDFFWTYDHIWNNSSDRADLVDASGTVVSTIGWGTCR